MKKVFLTAMAFAAVISSTSLTSCSNEDNPEGPSTSGEKIELNGTVEGTMTLDANNEYILNGTLTVADGATLEIPAGTKIKAAKGFGNYILVAQGGKINAKGTADKPIIFTADDEENATTGYWGGLIINGKAPISGATSGELGSTEVDNNQKYGGTDENDNSGTLEYVELRYTGARSSADIEHNGLTLNGVGRGTTIKNLYIIDGADDAIEFFGGTVNVENVLAVNCDDDMFDFTQGYKGTLSNCYGVWEAGFTSTEEDPRGVEADGNLDGNGADHQGQSDFTIENMTIATYATGQVMDDAIKVRRGATAHIENALVIGNGQMKDFIDVTDSKGNATTATSMSVTDNVNTTLSGQEINHGDATYENIKVEAGNTGANQSLFSWTGYTFPDASATASTEENLPTSIESEVTLDASKIYIIEGAVIVKEGGVLNIPAGTTLKAREGFGNYILVDRGGKINAEGTAEKPITFTADSESATAGYWGGLIINGKAKISGVAGTVSEGSTEIDNNYKYGGSDNADNSGVLKYVKLLYTGARSNADIEHNGLTLNAVGNGTTIENIYVANGADDAIEFFGGAVNVNGLLAVNCDDDMFDFTQGYCGTLSNCYGRWEEGFTSTEEDPRGVEADGNLDGNGADHTPQSDFKIENMTIENLSAEAEMQDAIKIRRGAKATITNALVKGSGTVTDLVDLKDSKGTANAATSINVTKQLDQSPEKDINTESGVGTVNITDGNTGTDQILFSWTGYKF